MSQIHAKDRELVKIQSALELEKQLNRKVDINSSLRQVKVELDNLNELKLKILVSDVG
ncbi:MAG: hypothetical protein KBT87_11080 [Gammaproteobacteria bacterium]|jgi:hypothetical protein|nr:hypothetical protein [Gammaproteobacteria bacterium]MBQ0775206.1 hypothetical protein [Gammaproteobacteria bacterium]MDF1781165.1 hypothetical protein [Alcanivoracaceae bacterium]|tara:strand:+ start:40628 stop:40801 length:174 start_codon:yes stop_codon:yes gene_type:complete